jgi:hypothetical protein
MLKQKLMEHASVVALNPRGPVPNILGLHVPNIPVDVQPTNDRGGGIREISKRSRDAPKDGATIGNGMGIMGNVDANNIKSDNGISDGDVEETWIRKGNMNMT